MSTIVNKLVDITPTALEWWSRRADPNTQMPIIISVCDDDGAVVVVLKTSIRGSLFPIPGTSDIDVTTSRDIPRSSECAIGSAFQSANLVRDQTKGNTALTLACSIIADSTCRLKFPKLTKQTTCNRSA